MGIFKSIMICLAAVLALSSCRGKDNPEDLENYVFRPTIDQTDLQMVAYDGDLTYGEKAVEEMLAALELTDKEAASQTPFVKGVEITSFELSGDYLLLYFNEEYEHLNVVEEVLLRSSLVQSLARIEGIEAVAFFVVEAPLTDHNGKQYGFMKAEDFIQNTGSAINSFEKKELTLYFTDDSGTALVKEIRNVRYNSNTSMEKVIIEQIMRGPAKSEYRPTISPEAKLLGVTVKEGICYVNFDQGFEQTAYNIVPEITIYSIVNSLVENGLATQVQISINGETAIKFQDSVDLSQSFSPDPELVK